MGYNNATLGLISVGMWYLNTGTYTNSPYAPGSDATSNPLAPNLQPAYTVGAQRYITLNWSRPIGNTGFASLSVNHNVTDHRASSVQLSFNWWLDGSINSGVAFNRLNHQDTVSAFASKGTPTDTGWGWGTAATAGPSGGAQARVEYQDDHYRANGSIANYGGLTTATAGANGSLIWMDGHAFASRRMDNSFAVVSTSGVPDVPVLRENNVVGRTNADGVLLVPQMQAYQRNQLAIDTLNLPAQMRIEKTQKTVTPTDRAGMLVTFDIQRLHAATVMMTDAQGKPLPIGSVVTASSSRPPEAGKPMFAASALVGIDGAAYFDNLPPHAILQAAAPTGYQCEARLSVPDIPPTDIPVLGPVACTTKAAP